MARGYVFKRCRIHGTTGTPARGAKPAVAACRTSRPPAGTWSWRAEGAPDPVTGRRTQPSRGGFASRDEAQEALSTYLAETAGGRRADDRRLSVEVWLRRWLAAGDWEPVTAKKYASHVENLLIPHLGRHRLRDLRHYHVERMCAELGRERQIAPRGPGSGRRGNEVPQRSARTVDSIRRTLRAALAAAVRRGLISDNPAAGQIEAIGKMGRAKAAWWQPGQLARFLAHVTGDDLETLWVTAAWTGLRREELLGLRVEDCALDPADPAGDHWPGVSIRQRCVGTAGEWPCYRCGKSHRGRQLLADGKTDAAVRWVPVAEPARLALLAQVAQVAIDRERWGDGYVDHHLVWAEPLGGPLRPDAVSKRHAALVAESQLPRVTLHQMRHGTASLLVAAGVPIEQTGQVLGHGSGAVTRSVYAHAMRPVLAAGMNAMVKLVIDARAQEVHNAQCDGVSSASSDGT